MRIVLFCVFFLPSQAHAYIGPGLGLGALGAILGVILSVFLAFLGIFWYPIKRLLRKLRRKGREEIDGS